MKHFERRPCVLAVAPIAEPEGNHERYLEASERIMVSG